MSANASWPIFRVMAGEMPNRPGGARSGWGAGIGIGTLAGDQLEALASGSPVVVAMVIGGTAGTMLGAFQWLVLVRLLRTARGAGT